MTELPSTRPSLSLAALIEALLFTASDPVTPAQIAQGLGVATKDVEVALVELEASLNQAADQRGLRLQRHQGRVQLTTAPEAAPWIERFLGLEATTRLTRASLETLAIIAYREPVTRPQIEAIRGVNCDGVMKSLLVKGLIQEVGRADLPGRPYLYSTTPEFLQHFGLNSVAELPPLPEDE